MPPDGCGQRQCVDDIAKRRQPDDGDVARM
jgi:hypothetical protein